VRFVRGIPPFTQERATYAHATIRLLYPRMNRLPDVRCYPVIFRFCPDNGSSGAVLSVDHLAHSRLHDSYAEHWFWLAAIFVTSPRMSRPRCMKCCLVVAIVGLSYLRFLFDLLHDIRSIGRCGGSFYAAGALVLHFTGPTFAPRLVHQRTGI
jgi:hypothetical protein